MKLKCESRVPATEGDDDGDGFKSCGKDAVFMVGGAVAMCKECSADYPEGDKATLE